MTAKPTSKPGAGRKVSKVAGKVAGPVKKTIKRETIKRETIKAANPVGRPTLYKEVYAEQAFRLCLLGATDEELAEFFHVTVTTIKAWKKAHPDFVESIEKGKVEADSKVVESLYKRATGYSHPDTHVSNYRGKITLTEITKHYPPDTAAAFIWLKNRQPSKWRDKMEVDVEFKLDQEMLAQIEQRFLERMEKARERQRAVLIERGILAVE